MIFLTLIFMCLVLLGITDAVNTRYRNVMFVCAGILLFSIAAFRPAYIDRDYANYLRLFRMNLVIGESLTEPSFILISDFIHKFLFANPVFLFLIYAGIAVAVKLTAIKKLSPYIFLSLLLYFSYSFILHEMTQIRAGVAVAFVLLLIKPLYERNAATFFLLASCAFFFHYSAVIVYFFWFLRRDTINVPLYAGLIVGSYLMYFFSNIILTDFVTLLPQGEVVDKMANYERENGIGLNVFNSWQLLRCLLAFFFLFHIDNLRQHTKYAVLLVKLYVFAAVSYILLAHNPTFATRISDLFSVVDIVLLPFIAALIRPRAAGYIAVVAISFFYLALNLYFNKIIA
jgi:hypothetical protein